MKDDVINSRATPSGRSKAELSGVMGKVLSALCALSVVLYAVVLVLTDSVDSTSGVILGFVSALGVPLSLGYSTKLNRVHRSSSSILWFFAVMLSVSTVVAAVALLVKATDASLDGELGVACLIVAGSHIVMLPLHRVISEPLPRAGAA